MSRRSLLAREAAVSAVINGALSLLFFVLVFGWRQPVEASALGYDFLPQAFMVSLMGSLVPVLLLRRQTGTALSRIVSRAVAFGIVGMIVAGGAAYASCAARPEMVLSTNSAIALKIAFGAVLGAIVTPLALSPLLPRTVTP